MPGLPTGETGLRERREEAAVSCDGHKMSLLSRARWSLHPGVNDEPHRLPSSISLKAHQPRHAPPPPPIHTRAHSLCKVRCINHHPHFAFTQGETGSERQRHYLRPLRDLNPQHSALNYFRWCLQLGPYLQTSAVMRNALD